MKELSIEEKSKAYEEALERAKMSYHTGDYDKDTLEMLEIIFPELKESDDEGIKNFLLDYIQKAVWSEQFPPKREIFTWLKKQGKQKSAWSEEDEKIALSIEQVMNCASLLNIVPDKVDKIRTWLKSLKERVQPKQKWGKEDEKMFDKIYNILFQYGYDSHSDVQLSSNDAISLINWLKFLRSQNK